MTMTGGTSVEDNVNGIEGNPNQVPVFTPTTGVVARTSSQTERENREREQKRRYESGRWRGKRDRQMQEAGFMAEADEDRCYNPMKRFDQLLAKLEEWEPE